jgi:NADPH-dependent 2,4-dienoyl-CoA reductase/sulfur reductase-like enzyme
VSPPVKRLIVVGGDAAGMSAASQARRQKGPDELEIIAFERGPDTSYSACGIPYWIGGLVTERDQLIARAPNAFRDNQQIDMRMRSLVTAIDTRGRTVDVTDLETGRQYAERYDDLVLGTGSVPVRPPIPGIDGHGVIGVHNLQDGERVIAELVGARVSEVVVIGAGYVGLELADAMLTRGLSVTVVDVSGTPMPTIDPDMGALVAKDLTENGIRLVLGDGVKTIALDASGRAAAVETISGLSLPAQLVILGLGVRPNVALAEAAGIALGPTGAIAVDRRMRTRTDGVWAAGDCVESTHVVSGRAVNIALGTHANKQGRVAGDNIGGAYSAFAGVLGTSAIKVCRTEIGRTGLSTAEAEAAGFSILAVTTDSTTRAGYYPDARAIRVKIIAERGTGRMLGAQIVGREESAKRIDILATAIWNAMTAEEFYSADLSYAPPYSPVLDPVVIAARRTHDAIRQDIRQGGGIG